MTSSLSALLDELCPSTVKKKTNRVEVNAATVRQVSALDMLKAQIRSRPPIVDAASRVVYDWFINWAAEFNGVSVSVPYGGYKSDYGELPALPERMRQGRRVGEPMCEGCSEIWETEQPPVQLTDRQIGQSLKWLVDTGYLVEELLIDNRGRVKDSCYYLLTDASDEAGLATWLELGYRFGQSLKRVVSYQAHAMK